jgi:hypothetical protein
MVQPNIVQKKTHILYGVHFLRNSFRLRDNVEKLGAVREATDDNVAHAHCMLDT